jgi:hypothetical protein
VTNSEWLSFRSEPFAITIPGNRVEGALFPLFATLQIKTFRLQTHQTRRKMFSFRSKHSGMSLEGAEGDAEKFVNCEDLAGLKKLHLFTARRLTTL